MFCSEIDWITAAPRSKPDRWRARQVEVPTEVSRQRSEARHSHADTGRLTAGAQDS